MDDTKEILTDTPWWNYKQAKDLPLEVVEKMWRTLGRIHTACEQKHPADPEFMTKDQIRAACARALPEYQ
ncbi:MAG: hypothetical protein ACPGGK_13050 [Pikeienuella sp.]